MTSRRSRSTSLGLAGLLVAGNALASSSDLFGVGVRSQGMAQTGVAYGEHDHQSTLNPALLGGRTQSHLSFGYQTALFRLEYQAAQAEHLQGVVSATLLGVTLPLPFGGMLEHRVALGFSAYSPRRLVSRAELLFPERPQYPLLMSQAESLGLSTGVGVELHPRVRVGVGVRWLASLAGSVVVSSSEAGETSTVVRDQLVKSTAAVAGVILEPLDHLRVGLVWRDRHMSRLDVKIRIRDLGSLDLPDLNIEGTAQYDPEQWDAEAAWVAERWQLSAGVRYRLWSDFPGFLGQTIGCPEGEEKCGTDPPTKPGFSNTWSPRLAVAQRVALGKTASAELRAGVAYEATPVPEQTALSNVWDNARWVASVGYGLSALLGSVPLDLDLAVQQHWLAPREHDKEPEAAAREPEFAHVRTKGQVRLVSLSLGVAF